MPCPPTPQSRTLGPRGITHRCDRLDGVKHSGRLVETGGWGVLAGLGVTLLVFVAGSVAAAVSDTPARLIANLPTSGSR